MLQKIRELLKGRSATPATSEEIRAALDSTNDELEQKRADLARLEEQFEDLLIDGTPAERTKHRARIDACREDLQALEVFVPRLGQRLAEAIERETQAAEDAKYEAGQRWKNDELPECIAEYTELAEKMAAVLDRIAQHEAHYHGLLLHVRLPRAPQFVPHFCHWPRPPQARAPSERELREQREAAEAARVRASQPHILIDDEHPRGTVVNPTPELKREMRRAHMYHDREAD